VPGEERANGHGHDEETSLPVVEEQAVVEKRTRPGATVRVTTTVTERDEEIDEELVREHVDVHRVPVGRFVDAPEPVREEGGVTIVPLYEEVLVVEKRLLLREELHLTKRDEGRRESRQVRLRRQDAEIERHDPDGDE
jgi:stress response protein YsnF